MGQKKHDRNRTGRGREPEKALFGGCKEKDGVMREEGSGRVRLVSQSSMITTSRAMSRSFSERDGGPLEGLG